MMKTRMRIVTVKGTRYVQVVERLPNGKINVLKSFGKYTLETFMEAHRYIAARDMLIRIAKMVPQQEDFHPAAFAVFGWILGTHEVEKIIHVERR